MDWKNMSDKWSILDIVIHLNKYLAYIFDRRVKQASGAKTVGNLASWDAFGQLADSGLPVVHQHGWQTAYSGALAPAATVNLSGISGFSTSVEMLVVFRKGAGNRVPMIVPAEMYVVNTAAALPGSTTGEVCVCGVNTSTWVFTNSSSASVDVVRVYFK
jgi:hypothetical protein